MGFFERMKKYNYNDVIEIYASCGHMCYTFSYNFDLNKSGDKWLFSCNCSVSDKEERVKSENREITQEEAENVIKAAEESVLADAEGKLKELKSVVYIESIKKDDYFAQTLYVLADNIQELRMGK